MSKLSKALSSVGRQVGENSPAILTGFAVAGLATTVVLAVRATPQAARDVADEKRRRDAERDDRIRRSLPIEEDLEFTRVDYIHTCWRLYLPAAIMGVATAGCIILSNRVSSRQTAAVAGAYSVMEKTANEYQEKVIETIGEKKHQEVKEAVYQDRLDEDPVSESQVIVTGAGGTLCYDKMCGRYFRSDIETLRKAENDFNARLIQETFLSLNVLYSAIGLDEVGLGEDLGWNSDNLVDFGFSAMIAANGEPCIVLDSTPEPTLDYYGRI